MGKESASLLPPPRLIRVVCGSIFFPSSRRDNLVPEGSTLASIIDGLALPTRLSTALRVWIDGEPVRAEWWPWVRPKAGTLVNVGIVPAGLSGASSASVVPKDSLRLAASVLVSLGGAVLPGALGLSGVAAALATAGIGFGGMAAVNALIPAPKTPEPGKSVSIGGTKNELKQYGPVWRVYGRFRVFPQLAAQPYYEAEADYQYINILYDFGYGRLSMSDFRIGSTVLENFKDFRTEVFEGKPTDPPFALFSQRDRDANGDGIPDGSLTFSEEVVNAVLKYANGTLSDGFMTVGNDPSNLDTYRKIVNVDTVVERTTGLNADWIGIELEFPNGLYYEYDQGPGKWRVRVHVQFRLHGAGDGAWTNIPAHLISNETLPSSSDVTETQLWQNLNDIETKLTTILSAVSFITGANRTILNDVFEHIRDYIEDLKTKLKELDDADGPDETPGWRELIKANLMSRLGDLGDMIVSTVFSSTTYDAFQSHIDDILKTMPALDAILQINGFLQAGYSPQALSSYGYPAWVLYWVWKQGLAPIFGPDDPGVQSIIDSQTTIVRRALRWPVGKAGQYDVRIRRAQEDSASDAAAHDEMYWGTLSTIRKSEVVKHVIPATATTPAYFAVAMVALRMRATDQLNGYVDTFNAECQAWLPVWNGSTWTVQQTRNPAWAFVDILCGSANRRAVTYDAVDMPRMLDWAAKCDASGFTFDHVFQETSSVLECLKVVATAGRASVTMRSGKWSVCYDWPQSTPVQIITPRNSWGFQGSRLLRGTPQALKLLYTNPDKGWQRDSITVYDDDHDANNPPMDTRVETIETYGYWDSTDATSEWHTGRAYREGRYRIASARLRPELFTLYMDIENLVAERGDLVIVQHDVTEWGYGAARITAITRDLSGHITALTIDDRAYITAPDTFQGKVRTSAFYTHTFGLAPNGDWENSLTLTSSYNDTGHMIDVGDLLVWGKTNSVAIPCIIKEIRPGNDLTAQLTLVEYNAAVYSADTEDVPPFDSHITHPPEPELKAPPVPVLESIASDESVLTRGPDGTLQSRIYITLKTPKGTTTIEAAIIRTIVAIEAQFRLNPSDAIVSTISRAGAAVDDATVAAKIGSSVWTELGRFTQDLLHVSVTPVQDRLVYDIRVRAITSAGVASDWLTIEDHLVVGKSSPPPDIRSVSIENNQTRMRWLYPEVPIDLAGFHVRFAHDPTGKTAWGKAAPAHEGVLTQNYFDFEALGSGIKQLMVKAVDTSGNESVVPAQVLVDLGDPIRNVLETIDNRALEWTGRSAFWNATLRGGEIEGVTGDIVQSTTARIRFWGDDDAPFWGDDADPFWPVGSYQTAYYEVRIAFDNAFTPCKLYIETDIEAWAYSIEYLVEDQAQLWPADLDDRLWPVDLSSPFWPATVAYKPWPGVLDIDAPVTPDRTLPPGSHQPPKILRVLWRRFRIKLPGGFFQGRIKQFKFVLDVPDLEETFENVIIAGSGDTRVDLTKKFRAIKGVQISLQQDPSYTTARTAEVLDKKGIVGDSETGPLLRVFDSSHAQVGGIVDATVRGY